MTISPCATFRPEAVHVGNEHHDRREVLAAGDDAEFAALLDHVDRIAAGIGEPDDLGLGGLRLQQERREVGGIQRMPGAAQHLAAGGPHDVGGIALDRMAKDIVGGDEEPAVAAILDDGAADRVRVGIRVIGPMRGIGRAGFAGDVGACRIGDDHDLFVLFRQLHHRERRRGCRHVDDHVDAFVFLPFAGERGGDIGLVEDVGADEFDRLAEHHAAEILDRHLGGLDVPHPADVGINRGEIGEHADLERRAAGCAGAGPARTADNNPAAQIILVMGIMGRSSV